MKTPSVEFSIIRVQNNGTFNDFQGDDEGRREAFIFYHRDGAGHPKSIEIIDVNLTFQPWAILQFADACVHHRGIPSGISCGAFVTTSWRVRETIVEDGVATDRILDPTWES